MSEIFISYAHEDIAHARTLAKALEKQGWTVWWDRTIPPGRSFDEVIAESLAAARCVIVLWSRSSVHSHWVKEEAAEAQRREILVPVVVEKVEIPLGFRHIQAARLIGWRGDPKDAEFKRLSDSLADKLREAPKPRVLAETKELVDSATRMLQQMQAAEAGKAPIPSEPALEPEPSPELPRSGLPGKGNRIGALIAFLAIAIAGNAAFGLLFGFLVNVLGELSIGARIAIFWLWNILVLVVAFLVGQRVWSGKRFRN